MKQELRFPVGEDLVIFANVKRMTAAYRRRLARRARDLGAEPPHWQGKPISIDEEEKVLLADDARRIEPYPYPGLRSFEPGEGEIFFGRDDDVEAVRNFLAKNRVVAVLGGSGSGKSSLLRAGLLPFLNTRRRIEGRIGNWYWAEFRPRTQPLDELASALAQLMLPLLRKGSKMGARDGLRRSSPSAEVDIDGDRAADRLRKHIHDRFRDASRRGGTSAERRVAVLDVFTDIAERQLDRADDVVTGGFRLSAPSLFLLVDQLEEVFRPEVSPDEREALLNLIVDLHAAARDRKGSVHLALTMRSEELHRCAEHRGLSGVVIGSGYQLELLDPTDPKKTADSRGTAAPKTGPRCGKRLSRPARNVFEDWGLRDWLKRGDQDSPFSPGMPDLLLDAAAQMSNELEHRPDELPLLQHALQATWHSAMKRWSLGVTSVEELEITRDDLPGNRRDTSVPDLGECLNARADAACAEAAQRFEASAGQTTRTGEEALRATFRALARRDDNGNWARRFAGRSDITVFLDADSNSPPNGPIGEEQQWIELQKALNSFLLRGYLNGGGDRDYDISHEALIRNWRKFQLWLRDPREVAYSLGRVLREVELPEDFDGLSDGGKDELIPQAVALRVAMVADEGRLPRSWGEDQIEPILQNSAMRKRWGPTPKALENVIALARMSDLARGRLQQIEYRKQFAFEQERKAAEEEKKKARRVARRVASLSAVSVCAVVGAFLGYYALQKTWDERANMAAEMRRVTALARDALWSRGPATAILMASRVQENGLPEFPESEKLLLTSLHQLREARVLNGEKQLVSGVSYSPDGTALVSSDPESLRFWNAENGDPLGKYIPLAYLAKSAPSFEGPLIGAQWSPGHNWIALGSRDQTILFAPCSREDLRGYFLTCVDRREDIIQLLGDGIERTGTAKFSADGNWLATGSSGTSVKLWDLASALPVRRATKLEGNLAWPNAFAISADKKLVAAGVLRKGAAQAEIKVYHADSDAPPTSLMGNNGPQHGAFVAIALNPGDSRMLAASSIDGSIFLWDDWSDDKNANSPIALKDAGTAFQIAFSRDGRFLLAAGVDGVVRMWPTAGIGAQTAPFLLRGHTGPVWAVAASPDGDHFASGSSDGSVILWNSRSAFYPNPAQSSATAHPSGGPSTSAASSVCRQGLALSHDFDESAKCVQSPGGRTIVASRDGHIEVFDKQDSSSPVDSYRLPLNVADIELNGDKLVVDFCHRGTDRVAFL